MSIATLGIAVIILTWAWRSYFRSSIWMASSLYVHFASCKHFGLSANVHWEGLFTHNTISSDISFWYERYYSRIVLMARPPELATTNINMIYCLLFTVLFAITSTVL